MGFAFDDNDKQLDLPETLVPARCLKTKLFYNMKYRVHPDGAVELMVGIESPGPETSTGKEEGVPVVTLDFSKGYKTSSQYSCPYCGAVNYFKCGTCKKISCWDGVDRQPVCPNCGKHCNLSGQISTVAGTSDNGQNS